MNGEVCCILGVCCPPGSEAQSAALAKELTNDMVCSDTEARVVAAWLLKHFDLAPKGTVAPIITEIAKMARKAKA
jgi:hypothetical protein